MKKYLMTGVAALVLCAAFTSCSHEEITQVTPAEKMQLSYEQAFIKAFGQPASNQDWGFGTTRTRANAGENYPATENNENANANEWADPDKEFGGWVVPDPLSPEQKALVAKYFQSVQYPGYTDPEWRHFFVQQVYTGGNTTVNNTTEGIIAADGSPYTSANMNLLTVSPTNIHINNFNKGTCSTVSVLDNGQSVGGKSHSDQISLMVNIDDTSCFGYHETGSSTHHNNKAALVSWRTIAQWAVDNDLETSVEGSILNDTWNRSFLGFDLAIQEGDEAMDGTATYDQAPEAGQIAYAWDGTKLIPIKEITEIVHTYYKEEVVGDYLDEYKSIFGKGWLTTNENFYKAADKVTLAQTYQDGEIQASSLTDVKDAVVIKDLVYDGVKRQAVLNLVKIKQLVDEGYLPVKDKSLTEWVKIGVSDGYYSDWIVTLTEGKRIQKEEITYQGRIMAEDLNANEKSDFDFNDVVFDWRIDGRVATIQLLAAGGTYPLTVGDVEVHAQFGQSRTNVMINTGAGPEATAKAFTYTFPEGVEATANNIPIIVTKNGVTAELTALRGKVASKLNVSTSTKWLKEYQDITLGYPKFEDWVQTPSTNWTSESNAEYLY